MEEIGVSSSSHLLDISKSAHLRQGTACDNLTIDNSHDTSCGNIVIVENSLHNRGTSSSVLVPLNSQNPGNILPLSNKLKISQKSMKAMPKITLNANNLQRLQKAKPQNIQKKNIANDLDDDLGNILDIPIIFAKDDDNLSGIDKMPVVTQTMPTKEPQERPKLHNTTKIVLISNKQDNKLQQTPNSKCGTTSTQAVICPNIPMQNLNRLVLQTRSQNTNISAKTKVGVPMDNRLMQPTVKYTKIILAKRKAQPTIHNERNEQIIATRTSEDAPKILTFQKNEDRYVQTQSCKTSINYDDPFADNVLEIEDAIKTNIIERSKYASAPAILGNDSDILNQTNLNNKEHASSSTFDNINEINVEYT